VQPLSPRFGLVWQISSGVGRLFAQAILPPPSRWGPPRNAKPNKHQNCQTVHPCCMPSRVQSSPESTSARGRGPQRCQGHCVLHLACCRGRDGPGRALPQQGQAPLSPRSLLQPALQRSPCMQPLPRSRFPSMPSPHPQQGLTPMVLPKSALWIPKHLLWLVLLTVRLKEAGLPDLSRSPTRITHASPNFSHCSASGRGCAWTSHASPCINCSPQSRCQSQ